MRLMNGRIAYPDREGIIDEEDIIHIGFLNNADHGVSLCQ